LFEKAIPNAYLLDSNRIFLRKRISQLTKKQHTKIIKAQDLLNEGCIGKFEIMLGQKYGHTKIIDEGIQVLFHFKIIIDEIPITIKFYTNGTLHFGASLKLDLARFDSTVESIHSIVKQCTESIHDRRPVSTIRAKEILEFASRLDFDKSNERMVAVILCDSANEIILTEIMKDKQISGTALSEGVKKKISYLEKKGIVIPFSMKLSDIREVRNSAVHDGQIPSEGQVATALDITKKFMKTM
jgi:hypothetical protein